jgi:hypothetical protein
MITNLDGALAILDLILFFADLYLFLRRFEL